MPHYRRRERERQPPTGWPDGVPLPPLPEPPREIEAGTQVGHIEIVLRGRRVRLALREPGVLTNGRLARSDTLAVGGDETSAQVLSLVAAAMMAAKRFNRPDNRRERAEADAIYRQLG